MKSNVCHLGINENGEEHLTLLYTFVSLLQNWLKVESKSARKTFTFWLCFVPGRATRKIFFKGFYWSQADIHLLVGPEKGHSDDELQ